MKRIRIALAATLAVLATTASANTIKVAPLTELREQGQLVQLQDLGGPCRYFGTLDLSNKIIRVESKACPAEDGAVVQEKFTALAKVAKLPAAAGTRLELSGECELGSMKRAADGAPLVCGYGDIWKAADDTVRDRGTQQ